MKLTEWQQEFVEDFSGSDEPRTLLIAAPGTGKTATSVASARRKLDAGSCHKIVVISDTAVLREQWLQLARANEINLDTQNYSLSDPNDGISTTHQSLGRSGRSELLANAAENGGVLTVFDEIHRFQRPALELAKEILDRHSTNQTLFIGGYPVIGRQLGEGFDFGREYLLQPSLIQLPETKIEIARYSPSISLLDTVKYKETDIDSLSWRQFEILISQLLEADGYEVQLMSGTKDGGVDIVAVKDLGAAGLYKTLWQAKKFKASRKIGIATIRELADVRREMAASKAIIVTSSSLTAGAIRRIERDKFILGKVDRQDLDAWIDRKLHIGTPK